MILYKTENSETVRVDGAGDSGGKCEDCLPKTNTTPFDPTDDYNPATKKYVDDLIGDISKILDEINRNPSDDNDPTPPPNPDDNKPTVEPFYLYDGSTSVNKLGGFTVSGYTGTSSYKLPTYYIKDNYIEITVEKEYYCQSNIVAKNYNFGITNIDKYSKLVIDYEFVSGKYYDFSYFGYAKTNISQGGQVGISMSYLTRANDDVNKTLFEINSIIGYDIDSICYTKYILFDTYPELRKLLIGTSTDYPPTLFRLGLSLNTQKNDKCDAILRVYKIWLE